MTLSAQPFCQRNIRLWLTVLGACSIAVLTYSIWLATNKGGLHGNHPKVAAGGSPVPVAAPAAYYSPGPPPAYGYTAPPSPASGYASPAPAAPTPGAGGFIWVARQTGPAPSTDIQSSFRQAADLIRPAVVSIRAIRLGARRVDRLAGVPYESIGSGLIVDSSGYVVTNDHVVAGATTFLVTRFQQANAPISARLLATDPRSDLALLKIDAAGPFPTVEFADSSKVEVGDWALAVGNPFGFGHTVTAGIISARRASISIGGAIYQGLLQTDAPINQGSSGGPLCNISGQVIGINTAIYAPTGVWSGAGFAIPSNRVTAFLSTRLPATGAAPALAAAMPNAAPMVGSIGSPWLGVTVIDVTPELAGKINFLGGSGAFVTSVAIDSPADAAELLRGDVITSVAGQPVYSAEGLRMVLSRLMPGQMVNVTVWRNGVERNFKVNSRMRG